MSDPFSPERTEVEQPEREIPSANLDVEEEYLPEDDDSCDDLRKEYAAWEASGELDESDSMQETNEDDEVISELGDDFSDESDEGGLWNDVGDAIGDILEDIRSDFAGDSDGLPENFGTWDVRDAGTYDLT